jgi:hypothetical protein
MPSPLHKCADCPTLTSVTRCRPCFNRDRIKRFHAGQPWKRTHDNFGAGYQNTTVSSSATKSWWAEAKRDGFTATAFAEVERMKLSTFGQTNSSILSDVNS